MAGTYQVLLIFRADRLSRNTFEYPMVLWQLQRAGVEVVAVAVRPNSRQYEYPRADYLCITHARIGREYLLRAATLPATEN